MWAVPWKGGSTAARLKGEGLGTDHATWLIGRRCVARSRTLLGPCVASSSLGMLYGSRGALGPSWGRAWQHREVPSPVRAYPCLCRRTTGGRSMHRRRRGCSKGAGSTGRGSGARCAHATCLWTLSCTGTWARVAEGTCPAGVSAPRERHRPPALECGGYAAAVPVRGGRAVVCAGAPRAVTV